MEVRSGSPLNVYLVHLNVTSRKLLMATNDTLRIKGFYLWFSNEKSNNGNVKKGGKEEPE